MAPRILSADAAAALVQDGDFVIVGGKFPRLTSQDPVNKIGQTLGLIESLRPVFSGPTNQRD